MSRSSDEGEKDRLTSEEFVDLIPHLPFFNIIQIEFFSEGWKRLIVSADTSKRLYRCNLCNLILSGPKSVLSHITGKKHIGNMSKDNSFYHPEYTFSKAQLQDISGKTKTINITCGSEKKENTVSLDEKVTSQEPSVIKPAMVKKATNESKPISIQKQNKSVPNSNEKSIMPNEKGPIIKEVPTQNTPENTQHRKFQDIGKESPKTLVNIGSKDSEEAVQTAHKSMEKTNENVNNKVNIKSVQNKDELKIASSDISPNESKEIFMEKPNDNKKTGESKIHDKVGKISVTSAGQLQKSDEMSQNIKNSPDKNLQPSLSKKMESPIKIIRNSSSSVNEVQSTTISTVPKNNMKMNQPKASDLTEKKSVVKANPSSVVKKNTSTMGTSNNESENNKSKQHGVPKTQNQLGNVSNFNKQKTMPCKVSTSQNESANKESSPSENIESQTNVDSLTLKMIDPEKKTLAQINESTKFDSRKLVKNPLAAIISSSSKGDETDEMVNVIVIDDNDDENHSRKSDLNEKVRESEPPAKKGKISLVPSMERPLNEKSNHDITASRSNLVVIPTRRRLSPNKNLYNKETTANEPAFAVRHITDTTTKDEICGFVGVEYVIKITRPGIPPKYECGLCELVLDGKTMQNHLLGYNHRLKFCEKHFPTAIQQFRQYIVNVSSDEHYKVMIPVLQKLSVAIEEHHGRSLPFDCDQLRYNSERHRVLTDVFARRHASEQRGPTFTHVVDAKQVDEFILRKDSTKLQTTQKKVIFDNMDENLQTDKLHGDMRRRPYYVPKSSNHNFMPYETRPTQQNVIYPNVSESTLLDDETHKRMVDNFLKANYNSNSLQNQSSRSSRTERDIRKPYLKRSHSPSRKRFASDKELNIWSSYCRLVDNKLKILEENFRLYRVNPESHPAYKNEWLKFWHRRKSELMAIGKDYRTYDYQPDWVPYFNNRINELYDEAFEKLKIETREELSLPMKNDYLCDPRYFVHVKNDDYSPTMKKVASSLNASHLDMQTIDSQMKSEKCLQNLNQEKKIPQVSTRPLIKMNEHETKTHENEIEIRDESAPTVVSVLRLLTALEEYLGSLGPKIVELLSKALQVEKNHQGRAHVLLTEENCTLLETAMEKFKGLVIAGILDGPKERALKKAISKVNALLDYTKQIKEKHPVFKKTELEKSTVDSYSAEDKSKIVGKDNTQAINEKLKQALQSVSNANDISKVIHLIEEKIAAALKAQGRTDVDRAHLEQLAAVCVLLEKKKQEAGNMRNLDSNTRKPIYQQPLSDTLKKIVGTINSAEHPSQNTPGVLPEARHIDKNSTNNVQMHSLNVGQNLQGNFSNVYSKNDNLIRMGDDFQFGTNSQRRPWQDNQHQLQQQRQQQQQQQRQNQNQQMQQQQQSMAPLLGWSQNSNRTWTSDERPTTSGLNSQWKAYENNFPQKTQFRGKFRHN